MGSRVLPTLISRTVHVKIYPTARTFAERTEVLRVLERFGQVDFFRSLKDVAAPNAFIGLFNKPEAAQEIINSSPLRYRIVPEPVPHPSDVNPTKTYEGPVDDRPIELRALEAVEAADKAANGQTPKDEIKEEERVFELRVSSSTYPHHSFIQRGPLYRTWKPISPSISPIASDLVGRIPRESILQGLGDWESGASVGASDFASNAIDEPLTQVRTTTSTKPPRLLRRDKLAAAGEDLERIQLLWPLYEKAKRKQENENRGS